MGLTVSYTGTRGEGGGGKKNLLCHEGLLMTLVIYVLIDVKFNINLIFRSNWRGLAHLGPSARPNKFINLATLGPSALASRGIITEKEMFCLIKA